MVRKTPLCSVTASTAALVMQFYGPSCLGLVPKDGTLPRVPKTEHPAPADKTDSGKAVEIAVSWFGKPAVTGTAIADESGLARPTRYQQADARDRAAMHRPGPLHGSAGSH